MLHRSRQARTIELSRTTPLGSSVNRCSEVWLAHTRGRRSGFLVEQARMRQEQHGDRYHRHDEHGNYRTLEARQVARGIQRLDHAEDAEEVVESDGPIHVS